MNWPAACPPLDKLLAEGTAKDTTLLRKIALAEAEASVKIDTEGPVRTVCYVKPEFIPPATWRIDFTTVSEANQKPSQWRAKSRRVQNAWKAVSRVIGPHLISAAVAAAPYHQGNPIYIRFVRLGGRKLDRLVNLPSSIKAIEDALAHMLGCDDGDPRWQASCDQRPGGPVGVEITISDTP